MSPVIRPTVVRAPAPCSTPTPTATDISTVYSDIVEANGTHDITYTWVTPSGQDINIPTTFDAAALTAVPQTEGLPDGYSYLLDGAETHYGISAICRPPVTCRGTKHLTSWTALLRSAHSSADVTDTADYLANSSQALLVTSSTGDGPAVGSVFNTFFVGDLESVYSAIPNGDGTDTVTDTIVTPWGNINLPTTFDAAKGLPEILNGTAHLGQDISTNILRHQPTQPTITLHDRRGGRAPPRRRRDPGHPGVQLRRPDLCQQ